jgi:D-3-phosphoglycerate dehydrogenase
LHFLAAQSNKSAIKSIKITAEGEIANYLDSLMTFATVGALRESIGDNINYVNAEFVAADRGIELGKTTVANDSPYKNKVGVRVATAQEVITIDGTVFNEDVQRVVDINGYDLDIEPKGKMILFRNSDVPGVIGEVGQTLAKHNINIADFRLGRNAKGALAVIIVDSEVQSAVLEELSNLAAAQSVAYAKI